LHNCITCNTKAQSLKIQALRFFVGRLTDRTSAAVAAAAVMAALVVGAAFAVLVLVVVALRFGVVDQAAFGQGARGLVGGTFYARVEGDAGLFKGLLCASAYAAADEGVSLGLLKEACESAVPAAVRVNILCGADHGAVGVIEFEAFGVAEMLEDLVVVFVGDSYAHVVLPF